MYRANGTNEFYSRYTSGGNVELFIDKLGNPTTQYPHVHVVHHQHSGSVDVVASVGPNFKPMWRTSLQHPSGQQLNEAIAKGKQALGTARKTLGNNQDGYVDYEPRGGSFRCLEIVWKGGYYDSYTRTNERGEVQTMYEGELFDFDFRDKGTMNDPNMR